MNASVPLCVDLDGTLIAGDTLHEGLVDLIRSAPLRILSLPWWLSQGKYAFKAGIAAHSQLDVTVLAYRQPLLEWLRAQRAAGRKLVLATASHRRVAQAVAAHLDLFDEVIASDDGHNLLGSAKRDALVARFGEKGFDYIGNEAVDTVVWRSARNAVVVGDQSVVDMAASAAPVEQHFDVPKGGLQAWLAAMRLHQWVKNALIFLPAVLAHRILQPTVLGESLLAFVSFGLCASSVYIFNDLFDLASDRRHPRKCQRPFASGRLSPVAGLAVALLLLAGATLIAWQVNPVYCLVLAGYYLLTWAYSLRLKRAALVDVMVLAGLYTIRIIAGAAATGIALSFWLLAFSVFIFISLGFVKRYTELYDSVQAGKEHAHGRGYWAEDLPLLLALGIAAGYCTVVVMALYINSSDSLALYSHNKPLWLVCPVLLYWISRIWLLTTRGLMHDDPVVFALKDRISLAVLGLLAAIVYFSI